MNICIAKNLKKRNNTMDENATYTGKHYVGEIVMHGEHECVVLEVWNVEGRNGITIKPTGNYGFDIDIFDEQL